MKLLKTQIKLNVDIQYDLSEDVALEKLGNMEVQMAIIPNNTQVDIPNLDVRVVTSLLPRILMVIRQDGVEGENLRELLENNLVIFESLSRMDSLFFIELAESYAVDLTKVIHNL